MSYMTRLEQTEVDLSRLSRVDSKEDVSGLTFKPD